MADIDELNIDDEVGYEYDKQIPDIVADDMSYEYDRRDSKEGFCEGDSDSGVDGVSSGCSTVEDCPVVSVNDVLAYYDIRPRRRHAPQLNFYHVHVLNSSSRTLLLLRHQ
ncbi:unnamed protein product, partial [Leptidea sinapis]